jgi:hypothetical protein
MIGRIVALAIVGGATLGCLVTLVFSIGVGARGAWHWGALAAIGAVATLLIRSRLPAAEPDDD